MTVLIEYALVAFIASLSTWWITYLVMGRIHKIKLNRATRLAEYKGYVSGLAGLEEAKLVYKRKEKAHKEECETMYHKGYEEGLKHGYDDGRKETENDKSAELQRSYNSGVNAGLEMGIRNAYLDMKEYIREKLGTEE